MNPKQLLECLKLTYDLQYASTVGLKIVTAAFPNASDEEKGTLVAMALAGFKLGARPSGVNEWTFAEIVEFFGDEKTFLAIISPLFGYLAIESLLAEIACRVEEVSSVEERAVLPFWFRRGYQKLSAKAA
jgi:hypothetical protein